MALKGLLWALLALLTHILCGEIFVLAYVEKMRWSVGNNPELAFWIDGLEFFPLRLHQVSVTFVGWLLFAFDLSSLPGSLVTRLSVVSWYGATQIELAGALLAKRGNVKCAARKRLCLAIFFFIAFAISCAVI